MLYIVTEDSKSGFQFWEAIKKIILDDSVNASIISACGIDGIISTVNSLNLKSTDTLLMCLDNKGTYQVKVVIKSVKQKAKNLGVRLIITDYYCMEEIFLSFSKLEDWVTCHKTDNITIHEYIRNCVMQGVNYFDYPTEEIIEFVRQNNLTNREHLASSLLGQYTSLNKGWHICKSDMGECWIKDCCKLPNIDMTAIEKVMTLENNSIFKNYNTKFNDLQKYIK